MQAPSWMLNQLNLETRMHHIEVDADQMAVLELVERQRYRDFLIRSYGFQAPIEAALDMTPNLELVIDLRERMKVGWIAADLLALGMTTREISQIQLCPNIEPFESVADAMGWLYVIERKTLLFNTIIRQLTRRIPDVMKIASSYLHCYEGVTGTRWRDLGTAFDRIAKPEVANRIVIATHQAFWCQREWFSRERAAQRAVG